MKVKAQQQNASSPALAPKKMRGPCTWEELAKHNTKEDCWVAMDGKVYDVTSWIPKHPGGSDVLILSAGRDVTNLFESYHPFSGDTPSIILKKYYICDMADTELPRYTTKSPLYDTMRTRVAEHLKKKNIDHKSSMSIYVRLAVIYLTLFTTYYIAHYMNFNSILVTALTAIIFGCAEALFSMHILHDASHCSITHIPAVWKWVGVTFDFFIGSSYFAWLHQHAIGHHLYTNVRGADPDLGEGDVDFRRVSPAQTWMPIYKYQHIYAPMLYGLLPFKSRVQDSDSFIRRVNGRIRVVNPDMFYVITYLIGKVSFITFRFVLPLVFSMSLGRLMLSFFLAEFVLGYYLAFVFQVSHVADGLDFMATPLPPAPAAKIDEDWAISQIRTTQDYGFGSALTTFFTGGLNYQVIHHLFPTVSQTYLPEIAPIIVQVCKEYNVKYNVLKDFPEAFMSHINYLKMMGQNPDGETPAPTQKGKGNKAA
jgi:fatty acid desaturase/predicted heme/steroid binding protein